jgi:hypothetical protein
MQGHPDKPLSYDAAVQGMTEHPREGSLNTQPSRVQIADFSIIRWMLGAAILAFVLFAGVYMSSHPELWLTGNPSDLPQPPQHGQ